MRAGVPTPTATLLVPATGLLRPDDEVGSSIAVLAAQGKVLAVSPFAGRALESTMASCSQQRESVRDLARRVAELAASPEYEQRRRRWRDVNGLRRPDKMLTHFQLFLKMKPDAPEARKVRAVLKTAR